MLFPICVFLILITKICLELSAGLQDVILLLCAESLEIPAWNVSLQWLINNLLSHFPKIILSASLLDKVVFGLEFYFFSNLL